MEHRSLGQFNTIFSTVAQGENETVTEYGLEVGEILAKISEVAEREGLGIISREI